MALAHSMKFRMGRMLEIMRHKMPARPLPGCWDQLSLSNIWQRSRYQLSDYIYKPELNTCNHTSRLPYVPPFRSLKDTSPRPFITHGVFLAPSFVNDGAKPIDHAADPSTHGVYGDKNICGQYSLSPKKQIDRICLSYRYPQTFQMTTQM